MSSIIETKRLQLRPITLEDTILLFEIRSDKVVMRYVERPLMNKMSEAKSLCANILDLCGQNIAWFWVLELKSTKQAIGTITLWNYEAKFKTAEIGFMMKQNFQGLGLMKEAASHVCQFAFDILNLNMIEAYTRPENLASCSVLRSLGFGKFKQLNNNVIFNNRTWDTIIFHLHRNQLKK